MSDPTLAPQDPPSPAEPSGSGEPAADEAAAGEPGDGAPGDGSPVAGESFAGESTAGESTAGASTAAADPTAEPPAGGETTAERRPGRQRVRGRGWLPPRLSRVGRPARPLATDRWRGGAWPRQLGWGREQLLGDREHRRGRALPEWLRRPDPTGRFRRRQAHRPPRHPLAAFSSMIIFGLLAAFFAWQSAEPFWLSLGHGIAGTATVTRCDAVEGTVAGDPAAGEPGGNTASAGATYPCIVFTSDNGAVQAVDVTLLGAGDTAREAGTSVPARMVDADRGRAYVAEPGALRLRWTAGLLLVLGCAAGIIWGTGATRLDGPRARRWAVLSSVAGPLLITFGFLVAAV